MTQMTKWQKKAMYARRAVQELKDATLSNVVHARHDVEAVTAAVIAGGIRGAFEATGKDFSIPMPGGVKLPPELLMGGLLIAVGAADAASNSKSTTSGDFHAAGAGILAYSGGREAEIWMRTRQKK